MTNKLAPYVKGFIVQFFDKTELKVTDAEAEAIKNCIKNGIKHFELGDEMFMTSGISKITKLQWRPSKHPSAESTELPSIHSPDLEDLSGIQ